MNVLIGDIGNTITKICVIEINSFKILKTIYLNTNKIFSKNFLKKALKKIFKKKNRSEKEFIQMQSLIKKYDSISDCFKRAEHFVNISYNALNIFNPSKEKTILQNLTSFSLERSF